MTQVLQRYLPIPIGLVERTLIRLQSFLAVLIWPFCGHINLHNACPVSFIKIVLLHRLPTDFIKLYNMQTTTLRYIFNYDLIFLFTAITIGIRVIGPALGFLLGALCTRVYVDPLQDPGYEYSDPRWVGAWWFGKSQFPSIPTTLLIL